MRCKQCGNEVRDNAKFCSYCGERIVKTKFCEACGEENDITANFCSECGQKFNDVIAEESIDNDSKKQENQESYWINVYENSEKNYNDRNWMEAYAGFKSIVDAEDEVERELCKFAYYYLAQIEIVEYWNVKYETSKETLTHYLRQGFEEESMLSLLQIVFLRTFQPYKIDEKLVDEVYQKRHDWKEKLISCIKEINSFLKKDGSQLLKNKELLLILETFLLESMMISKLEENESEDSRGEFFTDLLEKLGEKLYDFEDNNSLDDTMMTIADKVNNYGYKITRMILHLAAEDNEISKSKKELFELVERDWIAQMFLAECYYMEECGFDEDEDEAAHYYCMAGNAGIPKAMEEWFDIIEDEDEAKQQAKKWSDMGYAYAMKIYHEAFE